MTAVGASGPTITSAGPRARRARFLVLAVTGGSESGGSQIRDIGLGLALGILMDTFLVRSLLVPSTVLAPRPLELVARQAGGDGRGRWRRSRGAGQAWASTSVTAVRRPRRRPRLSVRRLRLGYPRSDRGQTVPSTSGEAGGRDPSGGFHIVGLLGANLEVLRFDAAQSGRVSLCWTGPYGGVNHSLIVWSGNVFCSTQARRSRRSSCDREAGVAESAAQPRTAPETSDHRVRLRETPQDSECRPGAMSGRNAIRRLLVHHHARSIGRSACSP